MNDGWMLWLILVGLAIGMTMAGLLLVRLPRVGSDVGPAERHEEATWIGSIIERHGGVAPVPLVEEVLELHEAYLEDARAAREPLGGAYPRPPTQRPAAPAYSHATLARPGSGPVLAPGSMGSDAQEWAVTAAQRRGGPSQPPPRSTGLPRPPLPDQPTMPGSLPPGSAATPPMRPLVPPPDGRPTPR